MKRYLNKLMKKSTWISPLCVCMVFFANLPGSFSQTGGDDRIREVLKTVEKDVTNIEHHKTYIYAMGLNNPELYKQYEKWMEQFPGVGEIPMALGMVNPKNNLDRSTEYLLRAVKMNPDLHEAWSRLSENAEISGQQTLAIEYMEKAIAINPKEILYLMKYAFYFKKTDPGKYKELLLKAAGIRPRNANISYALWLLAVATTDTTEKIKYLDEVFTNSNQKEKSFDDFVMDYYYDFLLGFNPLRAAEVAAEISKRKEETKKWDLLAVKARQIDQVNKLLALKKIQEAKVLLKELSFPSKFKFSKNLILLKAKADDMLGHTQAAYDSLVFAIVKSPAVVLKGDIDLYGKKLNKTNVQINDDISAYINTLAVPATNFTLQNYLDAGNVSLSDFKGKVVLLTYWFPNCGPCREEFPHFENVIKKFKGRDIVYLGLNIVGKENHLIEQFVKSNAYSFIPLDDSRKRDKGNLNNNDYAPINFLIDKEGRVVYSKFKTNEGNEDELEQMIRLLLERKST